MAQPFGLYALTAVSLCISLYFELSPIYQPSAPIETPVDLIKNDRLLWLLLAAAIAFLAAAITSVFKPKLAATIVLWAAACAAVYLVARLCSAVLVMSIFIFLPSIFLVVIIPTVLVYLSAAYSRRVFSSTGPPASPWHWLRVEAGLFTKGLAGLTLVISIAYLILEVSIPTQLETHPMTWLDTSNSNCRHEVRLDFEDAYGYQISVCSANLLDYLHSTHHKYLDVTFERDYQLGSSVYRVMHIDAWSGTAKFNGLMWSCSSSNPRCQSAPQGPPFHQPYSLQ